MYCTNFGEERVEGALFCGNCGKSFYGHLPSTEKKTQPIAAKVIGSISFGLACFIIVLSSLFSNLIFYPQLAMLLAFAYFILTPLAVVLGIIGVVMASKLKDKTVAMLFSLMGLSISGFILTLIVIFLFRR